MRPNLIITEIEELSKDIKLPIPINEFRTTEGSATFEYRIIVQSNGDMSEYLDKNMEMNSRKLIDKIRSGDIEIVGYKNI